MTIQIKDLPENENNTPAERLKGARENKGITRKKLSEFTGIPEKSIEKYEYGGMEPNISRLKTLCAALDIEPTYILIGEDCEYTHTEKDTVSEPLKENTETILNHVSVADNILQTLDTLRHAGFENSTRKTLAYFNELNSVLCFMEYDELLELAKIRDINVETVVSEKLDNFENNELYEENDVSERPDCEELANRIIDTAIFGIDFYSITLSSLSTMAEKYEILSDRFFFLNWRGHSEITPKIREAFLEKALMGKAEEDFLDSNKYKINEAA